MPETLDEGLAWKVRDGGLLHIDTESGTLKVLAHADELSARPPPLPASGDNAARTGRELSDVFRANVSGSESGATILRSPGG